MKIEEVDIGAVAEGDLLKVKFPGRHPFVAEVVETLPGGSEARVIYSTRMNGNPHPRQGRWRIVTQDEVLGIIRRTC